MPDTPTAPKPLYNIPPVFDPKTADLVRGLTPEQAAEGIANGTLVLEAKQQVRLVGADGKNFDLPSDDVASAIQSGARFETSHDTIARETKDDIRNQGFEGATSVGAQNFANQALFGVPEILANADRSPEQKEAEEVRQGMHETAGTIGNVAGFATSLATGAPLFEGGELAGKALESRILQGGRTAGADLAEEAVAQTGRASLSRTLAAKAANYAAQGAIASSPQVFAEALTGDPEKAAETLAWGIGTGALLGGSGALIKAGTEGAAAKASEVLDSPTVRKYLDDWGNNRTLKSVGFTKSQLSKFSDTQIADMANLLHDEGMMEQASGRRQLGDMIDVMHDRVGKDIGAARERLDTLITNSAENEMATRLQPLALQKGELATKIYDALNTPALNMPMNSDQLSALNQVVASAQTLGQDGSFVTFKDAQSFLKNLRDKWVTSIKRDVSQGGARGLEVVSPLDHMKSQAYSVARETIDAASDRVASAAGEPEIVRDLIKNRNKYAILSNLEKGAADLQRAQAGNRFGSLTDIIHMGNGIPSHITGAIGGVVGGFPGYIAGKAAGIPLDFIAKHWIEDKGMMMLGTLAKKAAKEGPQVFSAVLASEGTKRLTATLKQIPEALTRMSLRASPSLANSKKSPDPVEHLLGKEGNDLSHDKRFEKLTTNISNLNADPEAMADLISHLAGPIAHFNPALADSYIAKQLQILQYLNQNVPRNPNTPTPFTKDNWKPSPQQKKDFKDRAEVVINPMTAIKHLEQGTLNDAHLDALSTIYPLIKQEMVNQVQQFVADNPDSTLPYATRLNLSLLLNTPLDDSLKNIASLQATFQQPAPNQGSPTKFQMPESATQQSAFTAMSGPRAN